MADVGPDQIIKECTRILCSGAEPRGIPTGTSWNLCYHHETIREICLIREVLLEDCRSPARQALRRVMLGILPGPVNKGKPSYLSQGCKDHNASLNDGSLSGGQRWRQ